MSIIALFARDYSSAEEIVEEVSQRLGYAAIGKELTEAVARKRGVPEQKIARVISGTRGWLDGLTHEWERSLIFLQEAVAERLTGDDLLFVGPVTHLIPQPITHVLRVEVVGERAHRIQQAQEREKVDAEEAARRIDEADEALAKWTSLVLPRVSWDPLFHDLQLRVPSMTIAQAVDLICESVASETLRPTEASLRSAREFEMASRLAAKLLDEGNILCEVAVRDGRATVVVNSGSTPKGALGRTLQSLRHDRVEEEVRRIGASFDGIEELVVRPGKSGERAGPVAAPAKREEPPPPGAPGREAAEPVTSDKPVRLLLVDDDVDLVEHLAKRMKARGLVVTGVTSGEEGMEVAERKTFDVAVLDINMPGASGIETLRRLKQLQPMLQAIMLTGYGDVEKAFEAGQLDAVRFLSKPHQFDGLLEEVYAARQRKLQVQRASYEREVAELLSVNRSARDMEAAVEDLREKYEQW